MADADDAVAVAPGQVVSFAGPATVTLAPDASPYSLIVTARQGELDCATAEPEPCPACGQHQDRPADPR